MQHIALAPADRRAPAVGIAGSLLGLARAFWDRRREERRADRTIQVLQRLDDRTLKDIGIHRDEIESAVRTRCAERQLRYQ